MKWFWLFVAIHFSGLSIYQAWIIYISRDFEKKLPRGAPIPHHVGVVIDRVRDLSRFSKHGSWIALLGAIGAAIAAAVSYYLEI